MKLLKKMIAGIITISMLLPMCPVTFAAKRETFKGYNEHDIQALLSFAERQGEGLLNWSRELSPDKWICVEWVETQDGKFLGKFDMVNKTHEVTGNLDLSNCAELYDVRINCCDIKSVDVSNCVKLESFIFCEFPDECGIKKPGALESVNLTGCTRLTYFNLYYERISELDLSNSKRLEKIDLNRTNISELRLANYKNLKELVLGENDKLAELIITNCDKLESVNLIRNGGLTTVDLSDCAVLSNLGFWSNSISTLNMSGLNGLGDLSIYDDIGALNISDCKKLYRIYQSGGEMDSMNISRCSELFRIDCYNSKLKSLDLLSCAKLTELDCSHNELTELDLSGLRSLSKLNLCGNDLARISLTGCTKLTELDCSENRIRELDLSSMPELVMLACTSNPISELDITKNPKLRWVSCYDTNIKSIGHIKGYEKDIYISGIA